jgi:hypothetical protein
MGFTSTEIDPFFYLRHNFAIIVRDIFFGNKSIQEIPFGNIFFHTNKYHLYFLVFSRVHISRFYQKYKLPVCCYVPA